MRPLRAAAPITIVLLLIAGTLSAAGPKKKQPEPPAPIVPPKEGTSETLTLFDGKSFDGWEGDMKRWKIEDGEIVAFNDAPLAASSFLSTKRKFSDFRLTATVKLVKSEMHSGFGVWGHTAPDPGEPFGYTGHLVMFPTNWGIYELNGRKNLHVDNAREKEVGKQHDWNDLEIMAQGNRIRVVINGVLALDWRDPKPETIEEGPIALQCSDNPVPGEVRYKNLKLTTFPEDKLITVKEPAK